MEVAAKGGWTPGPLEAREDLAGGEGLFKVVIADRPNLFTALHCGETDARLYAAAPDLYEALAWLVEASTDPDSAHMGRALDNATVAMGRLDEAGQ